MIVKLLLLGAAVLVSSTALGADGSDQKEVRVADFGAIGDGVADDSAAIRAALGSARKGSTVIFDSGKTYLVRRMLVVKQRGLKLKGYGATVKFIVEDGEYGDGPGAK